MIVRFFENEFAAYHGARYGILMSNGTVTLEFDETLSCMPGSKLFSE